MPRICFGDRPTNVLFIFLIVMSLSDTLWAMKQPDPPAKLTASIGVFLSLTGKESVGQAQQQALLIAQRIRPLAGNKPVELIIKDTLGTSDGARNAVRSALDDHDIAAFIGGATKDEAAAMLDVVSKDRRLKAHPVPMVFTSAAAQLADTVPKPWHISAPLTEKARAAAGFAVGKLKAKRVGILVDPANAEGVRLASLFSSTLIAQGGVVAEIAYLGKHESTYRTALTALAGKKAEVIFLPDALSAPQVIVYSRDHGIKAPFLLADVRREGAFIKAVGASKDIYLVTDFHPAFAVGEHARRFLELYRREYGEPDAIAALAADAYFLLCDVLPYWRDDKGRHPQALSPAVKDKGYLSGRIDITKTGMIVRNVYVCGIHASRLKCLETIKP